ncbi:5-(carboxyamino)imidazole ribonucleotide mutase [Biformimicrobium ophioploci]|uniref:N5-carboxyaminoimidazole ribonucleotide mutase n=1 Tax=Biformimicrobium ophioploci TaxID=3036711 RepID=A0ABQ6LVK1_9GAMM|nr:5-(carboxyamino)imidazole ribonucleotide mutase [Microbulbifer sp. NKW57]GMG86115.1 5-(carboxyamino)imidazole ribonucleotide mutase [Microbulbifer sp. NKW57]
MNFSTVNIVMGSQSDWKTMQAATEVLSALQIPHTAGVVSAHRTPARLQEFAARAESEGTKVIIAGAGGAAHLPGMIASETIIPVVGVPVASRHLNGLDSLLSIVQMPRGITTATQPIGEAGAYNAGVMAAQILALSDSEVRERFRAWRQQLTDSVGYEIQP